MQESRIGIIGGSGLYDIEGIENVESVEVKTPFGKPSDPYMVGKLEGKDVVFLPRHGKGHKILPSELNFRANIYGMKKLGVGYIIAVSAVGSLKEEIKPLDMVVIDQFIDRTKVRENTFFGNGVVCHTTFADPICNSLASIIYESAKKVMPNVHKGGTYICMEGPLFSTRAESNLYRQWGGSVIGMTNLQEAKLAREAQICYSTLAMATDYDCWHEEEEDVTVEMIIANLMKNVENAKKILKESIKTIDAKRDCKCVHALKGALISQKDKIPQETKKKLDLIIGEYL